VVSAIGVIFLAAFLVLVVTFLWVARLLGIGGSRHVGRARGPASDAEEGVDGLILGTLACLLFKLSPLMAILSAVSRWYCGRALFVGLHRLRNGLPRPHRPGSRCNFRRPPLPQSVRAAVEGNHPLSPPPLDAVAGGPYFLGPPRLYAATDELTAKVRSSVPG